MRFVLAVIALVLYAAAPAAADDIVVLHAPDQSVALEAAERGRELGFDVDHQYARALRGFSAHLTSSQAAELRADPEVAAVIADRPVRAAALSTVTAGDTVPPGVRRVISSAGARQPADGAVAVLDTGIDLEQPDLNVREGVNCINPGARADDSHGHGTHVAGTIAARNDGHGVVGVAPGTVLYAVKVLDDDGNGTLASELCGLEWVLANAAAKSITVANLSLGGPGPVSSSCAGDLEHAAICALADAGVTPVVSAGNKGTDITGMQGETPAAYPEALTVTAIADTDGVPGGRGGTTTCSGTPVGDDSYAPFSNYATTAAAAAHTIAAPGVCVRSTLPGGGTGLASGTSMAAPHVAGLVALCKGEGGVPGQCAGQNTAQVIATLRVAALSDSYTPRPAGLLGPLALLPGATADPAASAPATMPPAAAPAAPGTPAAGAPVKASSDTAHPPEHAPVTPPAAARTRRPTLTVRVARRTRSEFTSEFTARAASVSRAVSASLSCASACDATLRAEVSARVARKLKLRTRTVATAQRPGAGETLLPLTGKVLRRVANARARLTIRAYVTIDNEHYELVRTITLPRQTAGGRARSDEFQVL